MTAYLPIACALSGDELLVRLDEIRSVSREALRAKTTSGARAVLTFDPAPGVRDRLAAIVAAEAKCCAFLTMDLAETPDGITLTIEAPDDAAAVLAGLVASFEPADGPRALADRATARWPGRSSPPARR
jgi:hypothetical protein